MLELILSETCIRPFHWDFRARECILVITARRKDCVPAAQGRVFPHDFKWVHFPLSMENVIDSRRHLLLYATKKSPVFPVLDERSQQKAARRGLRTALGNALVCILYIGVLFLFLAGGKLHGFLDMVLTAVSLPLSLAGLGFAVGYLFRIPLAKKDSGRFLRTHAYRLLDHAVLATFLFLAGLALYLLFGAVGSFIGR